MLFDNTTLLALAERFGTPLYVYSENAIADNFERLSRALANVPHDICYAVKANSNLSILQLIRKIGGGFDIVSGGELLRVMKAGGNPSRVVFAGVGKTDEEIELAIKSGVRFLTVESVDEVDAIERVASNIDRIAHIALRINPEISIETHPYMMTGHKSTKFGISPDEAFELWERISQMSHVRLIGMHCHIGTGSTDIEPFITEYKTLFDHAEKLRSKGAPIQYLDFGGGFGVSYSGHYRALDINALGKEIEKIVKGSPYTILVEPGKFLVAEAGLLLTRVIRTKRNAKKSFVIVDAGMNDLIRPALYGAYHHISLIPTSDAERRDEVVDVVGPVCESGCFLAKDRELPFPLNSDLLVVADAGAYGFAMASRYNTRGLPAEVLVTRDGRALLIGKRETYEDMIAQEVLAE